MSGYELYLGGCVAECGDGEQRNANGVCVCMPGYQRVDGMCKQVFLLTVSPTPKNGYVTAPRGTGDGISCGYNNRNNCEEYFLVGERVPLSRSAKPRFEFKTWVGACTGTGSCTVTMSSDKNVSALFKSTLRANAGGPYTASYTSLLGIYTAVVTASATGGMSPYTFRWQERDTGATAVYVYTTYPSDVPVTVTVTDSDGPANSDSDTATINASASSSRSTGEEEVSFDVPLGGDLHFVWGEDSAVTASSGDVAIVEVSVSSPAIRVRGVAVGKTDVILQTDSGELRLPVVVK